MFAFRSQKEIVDSIGSLFLGKSCTLLPIIPEGTFQPLEVLDGNYSAAAITSICFHIVDIALETNAADLLLDFSYVPRKSRSALRRNLANLFQLAFFRSSVQTTRILSKNYFIWL